MKKYFYFIFYGKNRYNDNVERHELNEYRVFSDNSMIEDYWETLYLSIRYCNVVIDNAHFAKESNPDEIKLIENYIAQARVIRAFDYFSLVRSFGGVPLMVSASSEIVARSTAKEVYSQIFNDLDMAISSKALQRADEIASDLKGQFSEGTALALQAKAYMYRAALEPEKANDYFTDAYNASKELIQSGQFSLTPGYNDLWELEGKFSDESIIEIGYPKFGENWQAHHWYATWFRPRYLYDRGTRNKIPADQSRGWGFNTPTQDFVNSFEKGDPRLYWTVWFPGDTAKGLTADGLYYEICFHHSETGYYYRKTTIEQYHPSNKVFLGFKIYRYADLLLLAAEAANEIGETNDALTWLNMVRERARNTPPPVQHVNDVVEGVPADVTVTDQNELRDIIRQERRVELGCEGERFFDLYRWHGTHGYDLKNIIEKAYLIAGTDYQQANDEPRSGQKREPKIIDIELPKHLLLPVPKREIELTNGLIEQTEGY